MPDPRSRSPRTLLLWGLAVVVLLTAAGVGFAVVRRVSGGIGRFGTSAPPVITQQVVVEKLQTVAKLVCS